MVHPTVAPWVAVLAGVFLVGCAADTPASVTCAPPACSMDASATSLDGGSYGYDVGHATTLARVTVTPATTDLRTAVGTPQSVTLHASGSLSDGTTVPLTGAWSVPDASVGTIDPTTGVFITDGSHGGTVTVSFATVLYGGGTATATVTVWLTSAITPPMGSPGSDGPARFAMTPRTPTDPSGSPQVVYPLDGVVFPQNITPPTVQWSGPGVSGDLYRVVYLRPHVTVTQYVAHTGAGFAFSAALPDSVWTTVAGTDPRTAVTVTVDHLDAARRLVYGSNTVTAHLALGSVSGSVYYWSMSQGQLHRIPAATVTNEHLFPSGIVGTADTSPSYTYASCIACHQISRDGRYLLANGNASYVFDLVANDPTAPSVPVRVRPGYRWYFATMSPDDRRVFATMPDTTSSYVDAMTLHGVTSTGSPLPAHGVAHPNWSPDGNTIAVISNVTGWTSNASFTGGDLTLIPVTGADGFGPAAVVHQGASLASTDPAGGRADAFPSWTPDNRWVVFAHTSNTRAAAADRAPGSLYILPPRAGAVPVRLAHATDDGSTPRAHFPNLSPFTSGGYYWVVFYSDRDYGNMQAGSAGSHRPQLWVSAIAQTFDGSTDPSQVPYWLPGQDVSQQNADAVWAASPCRPSGASCRTATDCCGGACTAMSDGGFTCSTPSTCRREGESCQQTADCCGMGTLTCDPRIHICQQPIG